MTTSTKILIKEKISLDLALRDSATDFFDYLESLSVREIIVDFKDICSISHSFAHEYIMRKRTSQKKIREVNVPQNVRKMFVIVEEPRTKQIIFDARVIKAMSL